MPGAELLIRLTALRRRRRPHARVDLSAVPDATLVGDAAQGDRLAFGELHRRFARLVHGVLLAKVSPQEADDLVQEVFLQAMQRLDSLREPSAFGAWISQIARRRAADFYRSRGPVLVELPEDLPRAARPGAEAAQVLRVIQAMPEAYRETLLLRLVEGMTGPEIAHKTGLTPGSVRVNLHRGMKMLREQLGVGRDDE